MPNDFTLDSLREEVEKEFAPVKITLSDGTEVVLRNLLRLGKNDRTEAIRLLGQLDKSDTGSDAEDEDDIEELLDIVRSVVPLLADTKPLGNRLVRELGDDIPLIMTVLNKWMDATQPGEAPSSQV